MRHPRVKIHPISISTFPVSVHTLVRSKGHWSFVMSLFTGVWKPEGEGRKMGQERYISHVSSVYKPDANFGPMCIFQIYLDPENLTVWLSHLVLAAGTLLSKRRNPPPRGTLFNYKPTKSMTLDTSLSSFHFPCLP